MSTAPRAVGISRSRSSNQISSLAQLSEQEAEKPVLLRRTFSGSTISLPSAPSPLQVSKTKTAPDCQPTPLSPLPLTKRPAEKIAEIQISLQPSLAIIPHTPPTTPLQPEIQIKGTGDTEEPELSAIWQERQPSSQLSDNVHSTASSRTVSPDFLRMQSMLGQFREKRRFSATAEIIPRLPKRQSGHQSGTVTPDKKLMQFLASDFSQRRRSTPAVVPHPRTERKSTPPEDEEYLQDLPVICGLNAVLQHPRQGIPEQHLINLQGTAKVYRLVMSIRPFPKVATAAALAGSRSKGLGHKEKSTDWGPHVPFLPLQQKYSKLFNEPEEVIAGFQAEADKVRDEAVPLKLSPERLEQLQKFTLPESNIPLVTNVCYEGDTFSLIPFLQQMQKPPSIFEVYVRTTDTT